MDIISFNEAATANGRIEKFIENPDSNSGIVTVPKTIGAGESVTIPAGRMAVLPNVQVDGTLNIEGEVFIPTGATLSKVVETEGNQTIADVKTFTSSPIVPTPSAQDNSTKVATTAYVDGKMVLATAVTASGTAIDFTGIPSWAKRITVILNGISLSGSSVEMIQIGSGSIQTTGYKGAVWNGSGAASVYTNGFKCVSSNAPTDIKHIIMTLIRIAGNTWVASLSGGYETVYFAVGGGSVTLSGVLNIVRITTANGTDTFDAGQINIMYEG